MAKTSALSDLPLAIDLLLFPMQDLFVNLMTDTSSQISKVCDSIKQLLLDKNKKYGDSAIDPIRVFSKADPIEQILVRIDDKLSRISRGAGMHTSDEDTIDDLIGYLVLLKVCMKRKNKNDWDGSDLQSFNMNSETINMNNGHVSCNQAIGYSVKYSATS